MASNPIKRRARQSFFIGFLLALVIMAVAVVLLFMKIKSLNEENEKLKIPGPTISVYTVSKDIEEGEEISLEDLQLMNMQLSATSIGTMDVSNYIDPSIFSRFDEENNEEIEVSYTARVHISAGTVVTLEMLKEGGIANDERLMEYGMIILPSQLKNGDYIDIRLRLADGTERIILSKKKINQCTNNTIWMKMKELEILTMNSAIIDAYTVAGSQLRATLYTNPLMQDASEETYPVNNEVLAEITRNPNILVEAKNELIKKWNKTDATTGNSDFVTERRVIDSYVVPGDTTSAVESGYSQEASEINNARSAYVSALEGTGLVGTTTE